MNKLELFLEDNNFLPNESVENAVYKYKSIKGLKKEQLSGKDITFLINSLFSTARFLNFSDQQKFNIDRVKENEEVNQFWVEAFKSFLINYRMRENEFSIFCLVEEQKGLIEKAFSLNIKELPVDKMKKVFEGKTNEEQNKLFEQYMKVAVLKIFKTTFMEEKIRTEYIELALKMNEENMMKL